MTNSPSAPDSGPPGPPPATPPLPAAATGSGEPSRRGNGEGKPGLSGAVIGAAGAVLAAIIGGVFGLIVAFQHSGPSRPAAGPTPSAPPHGLAVTVRTEDWLSPVNGQRAIRVTGTVRNLPLGVAVLAFAGPHPGARPYYVSGPAHMHSDGSWQALIEGIPAADLSLTFWPGEVQLPIGTICTPACRSAAFASARRAVAATGPRARSLRYVGQPVRGHA